MDSESFRVMRPSEEPPRTVSSTPTSSSRPPSRHQYALQQTRRNPILDGEEPQPARTGKKPVPDYYEHMSSIKEVQRHKKAPVEDSNTRAGRSSKQESVERFGKKRVQSPERVVHDRPAKRVIPVESRNPILQGDGFVEKQARNRGLKKTVGSSFRESEEDMALSARRISKSVPSHPPQSSIEEPVYLGGTGSEEATSLAAGIKRFEQKTASHKDIMSYSHAGKISVEGQNFLSARDQERRNYEESLAQALREQRENRETYETLRRKLRPDKTNPALENFLYDGQS